MNQLLNFLLTPVLPLSPGVPVADSGRGECVLSYRGVEQCTSAVCAVSPGPPGDGCFAPGVWGASGWAVREWHDLSMLCLSCWTSAPCHLTLQKRCKGQLIPLLIHKLAINDSNTSLDSNLNLCISVFRS